MTKWTKYTGPRSRAPGAWDETLWVSPDGKYYAVKGPRPPGWNTRAKWWLYEIATKTYMTQLPTLAAVKEHHAGIK